MWMKNTNNNIKYTHAINANYNNKISHNKNMLIYKYDGFFLWSKQMYKELSYFYPYTKNIPVYIIGAPQFDIFFNTTKCIKFKYV